MRLVKITNYYEAYLRDYEARFPQASELPYARQLNELLSDCFDWGYFWQPALAPLGYEFEVLVVNKQDLQMTWARENGFTPDPEKWKSEIVIEQLKKLDPEIVWFDDIHLYRGPFIRDLKALFPKVRLWMVWSGSPPPKDVDLSVFDLVLSNLHQQVAEFNSAGVKTEYFCHAFSPRILELLGTSQSKEDPFTFIGSIFSGSGGHNSRIELLAYLAQNTPLAIHSILPNNLAKKPGKNWLYHQLTRGGVLFCPWEMLPQKWRMRHSAFVLKDQIRTPIFGLEMFRKLQSSQISLNQHIDVSRKEASNMRLFEATGVGTCLLTDVKSNLTDFFEPDREIVTYRSPSECLEKYEWLSCNPKERQAIAKAGQTRTLQSHTFANRAPLFDEIVRRHL